MRAICFGRINVQNAGTPVHMGVSILNGSVTSADQSLTVNSATPFTQDMCPFKATIDSEIIMVQSLSGTTFTSIKRGIEGTTPTSHLNGAGVSAMFKVFGWQIGPVAGLTGKQYWGSARNLIPGSTGVIYEFVPKSTTASVGNDSIQFVPGPANCLNLTDYAMDVTNSGDGLYVTLWSE